MTYIFICIVRIWKQKIFVKIIEDMQTDLFISISLYMCVYMCVYNIYFTITRSCWEKSLANMGWSTSSTVDDIQIYIFIPADLSDVITAFYSAWRLWGSGWGNNRFCVHEASDSGTLPYLVLDGVSLPKQTQCAISDFSWTHDSCLMSK